MPHLRLIKRTTHDTTAIKFFLIVWFICLGVVAVLGIVIFLVVRCRKRATLRNINNSEKEIRTSNTTIDPPSIINALATIYFNNTSNNHGNITCRYEDIIQMREHERIGLSICQTRNNNSNNIRTSSHFDPSLSTGTRNNTHTSNTGADADPDSISQSRINLAERIDTTSSSTSTPTTRAETNQTINTIANNSTSTSSTHTNSSPNFLPVYQSERLPIYEGHITNVTDDDVIRRSIIEAVDNGEIVVPCLPPVYSRH